MNSCDPLGAFREPTFHLIVTCVDTLGRLSIPLAYFIFCGLLETIHHPFSALPCLLGPIVNLRATPILCGFFETIHDTLSAILNPLGPKVNSWDALEASREPTLFLNMTCVGTTSRPGIPLASPIFCRFFGTIHDPLSALPCPLGPNVNRWRALRASRKPKFPVFVNCMVPWTD